MRSRTTSRMDPVYGHQLLSSSRTASLPQRRQHVGSQQQGHPNTKASFHRINLTIKTYTHKKAMSATSQSHRACFASSPAHRYWLSGLQRFTANTWCTAPVPRMVFGIPLAGLASTQLIPTHTRTHTTRAVRQTSSTQRREPLFALVSVSRRFVVRLIRPSTIKHSQVKESKNRTTKQNRITGQQPRLHDGLPVIKHRDTGVHIITT